MRKVDLPKGGFILINESSKELPINRFTDFQKYLIQDAGIGSTMGDVERHFGTLDQLLSVGKVEEAARERYNLHFNLHLALNRISIRHLSFLTLVAAIDDNELIDYSEKNLLALSDDLGARGLTEELVVDILESVKKNSILT